MAKTKVIRVPREVIENTLLTSIGVGGKVAMVFSREDLDILIKGFDATDEKSADMLRDLRLLRKRAFGEEER